jgi:hypothetical protein
MKAHSPSSTRVTPKYHIHNFKKSVYKENRSTWVVAVASATILVVMVVGAVVVYRWISNTKKQENENLNLLDDRRARC